MSGALAADAQLVAEILAAAEGAATQVGSPSIGAEHLLIGCLITADPSARVALAADGVDDRAVRSALTRVLDRLVLAGPADNAGSESTSDALPEGAPTLSAEAVAVLSLARTLSLSHRPRGLLAADVLTAVAEQTDGVAAAVLDDLGVDRRRLFDFRDWAAGH